MEAKSYTSSLDRRHLRLVTIRPGANEEEICVSIDVVPFDLENPPKYEALSYVWGSESDKLHIRVVKGPSGSAGSFMVTRNLRVALKHIRLRDRPRVLWVDAICINQEDIIEKAHQVAMMGKIYRLAQCVIAWLGPSYDNSDRAMKIMHYIGSQIEVNFNTIYINSSANATDRKLGNGEDYAHSPFSPADRESLYMLLRRPWFNRLWIRQEIYLGGSNSSLMCGLVEVPWIQFRKAMAAVYSKAHWTRYNGIADYERFITMSRLTGFIFQHSIMGLANVRRNCGNSQCKDPRDRIYPVLGMLNSQHEMLSITPDYSKSTAEVYQDATINCLIQSYRADYLKQCRVELGTIGLSLASWIPDFSRPRDLHFEDLKGDASSSLAPHFTVRPQSSTLSLAGVFISKVEDTGVLGASLDYMDRCQQLERLQEMSEFIRDCTPRHLRGNNSLVWRARIHLVDAFDTLYHPPARGRPNLQEAIEGIKIIDDPDISPEVLNRDGGIGKFFCQVFAVSSGQQLCRCTDGVPILAPPSVQKGDRVCVFLGCESTMILRPVGQGQYRLVGPAWRFDTCYGEAILEPLPENVRVVINSETLKWAFLDDTTGDFLAMDPRLSSLPKGLVDLEKCREDLQGNPRAQAKISLEILNEHAIGLKTSSRNIQLLDLV